MSTSRPSNRPHGCAPDLDTGPSSGRADAGQRSRLKGLRLGTES